MEAGIRRLLTACLLLAAAASEGRAQRAQWTDIVYVPGRWEGGRLVRAATANPQTDALALLMRADYFSAPPRWRVEVRRTRDGQTLGEPDVLVGEGARALVVTPVGTTPLDRHALGQDSLVRAALVFDAGGRPRGGGTGGPAAGRIVETAADGSVARVVYRRVQRSPTFGDDLLNPRGRSVGRQLLASRITAVGDQRSAGVVATAGARGVDRVSTPGGEVAVKPDSLAVAIMERLAVGAVALEEFLRSGGLGAYGAPRPPEAKERK